MLDADSESQVGDVARELAQHVGYVPPTDQGGAQIIPLQSQRGDRAPAAVSSAPPVYVDGYALDPGLTVTASPLRDGAVVSLHDPAGCLPGEPTGVVELRVVGGPAAGRCTGWGSGGTTSGAARAVTCGSTTPRCPSAP
ncbi:hypothetical protein NKH77_23410 [Streptomyces sp. M19]